SVTTTLIKNVETQLGLIEHKRSAQVVDNKEGSNTVQHSESTVGSNIAYVEQLVQSATGGRRDRSRTSLPRRVSAVDLAHGPSDCASVLHHGHSRYARLLQRKAWLRMSGDMAGSASLCHRGA